MSCWRSCETCKPLSFESGGAVDLRNIDNVGTRCRGDRGSRCKRQSVRRKSWQHAVLHPRLFPRCRPVPLQVARQGHVCGTRRRPHQLLRHRWHRALGGCRHRLSSEEKARTLHERRYDAYSGGIYKQRSGEFAFGQASLNNRRWWEKKLENSFEKVWKHLRGDVHMTSTLRGEGGLSQKKM